MFNIEMAGYAALAGLLALATAVFIVPDVRRPMGWSSAVILKDVSSASVRVISCLFLLILIFLRSGLESISFLAGIFSAFLFLFFSQFLFGMSGDLSPDGEDRSREWSLCLAAPGLALAAIGIYLAIFAWQNVSMLNAFALGEACAFVLIVVVRDPIKGRESDRSPALAAADFHVSSVCALAAAMTMGAAMPEYQQVWIGVPVLFAMAGLTMFSAAAIATRAAAHGRPRFYGWIACLSILSVVILSYAVLGELTRKMPADTIADLGMIDRMGPFWASMTGVLTGMLLLIVTRRDVQAHSGRSPANLTFGFSLYFMAAGVWIAYLFSDLYGVAFAGMGLMGAVCLRAAQRVIQSGSKDSGWERGFRLSASAFSTLAVAAAGFMQIRETADFDDDQAAVFVLAGMLLGAGLACVMRFFVMRLSSGRTDDGAEVHFPFLSADLSACLAFIFVPVLLGLVGGPEVLGGFFPGLVLVGVYDVFRLIRRGESENAGRLNGLLRLVPLAVLAAASLLFY